MLALAPAQAQVQRLTFIGLDSGRLAGVNRSVWFDIGNIPASAQTFEARIIPPPTLIYPLTFRRSRDPTWHQFLFNRFEPGTRVWIEVKALDADGNRVGYGSASIRTADTRSLAFTPKGERFTERFSVHISDVPSATTGFEFRVLNPGNGQVIASRNYSTNPRSYNNGAINVISVCAQGCDVSAKLKPGTNYHVEIIAKEVMYEISRLRKSVRTKELTLGDTAPAQAAPAQAAPASEPAPEPIALAADIHNASEVTVQWSAVSGATGYKLAYAGSDMTSGSFTLGAGATSQRITGLSAGVNYKATLTANLPGGEHSGEIHFVMPNPPPPTSTPTPTNTPVSTSTPVPTNTPVPTSTPAPTSTPVPQQQPSQQQPSGPYASLMQNILGWRDEQPAGSAHHERWTRALAALGYGSHANPMTASEAQGYVDRGWGGRWQPVVNALTQLNPPPPTSTPVPTSTPLPTNTPVPTSTPVPQEQPSQQQPEPQQSQPSYSVPDSLIQTVRGYYDTNVAAGRTGNNWLRVLIAFGVETHDSLTAMSAAEARERVSRWGGWRPIAEALEQLAG